MLDRRQFLALSAAAVACDGPRTAAARWLGASVPAQLTPWDGAAVDPAHHLLNRAAFGPWPGDVEYVRSIGAEAWIDEQLDPASIDDTACMVLSRRFESTNASPGNAFDFEPDVVAEELARHVLLRAVHSKRQLFEVMVAFFTDHFNISVAKGDCAVLKSSDDRDVIRQHALGRFADLVRASALSPAMLVYLDGTDNTKRDDSDQPNENYARELLELHTLGLGAYTQRDVMEAARCLTGWTVRTRWRKGTVDFHPDRHDDGAKRVLGVDIPAGGGASDLDALLDIVCTHPATAVHLATKLCRTFIADDPPAPAIDAVAATFVDTDGDIAATVRAVLVHPAFAASSGGKLKRPFRFIVSALRGLGAVTHAEPPLLRFLERLGQPSFEHPTPDGYPAEAEAWLGTMFWRWNFASALARGRAGDTRVPWDELFAALDATGPAHAERVFAHLIGRAPEATEVAPIRAFLDQGGTPRQAVALLISSPAFQVC
jgi:uncharacterized protein (DUF1800 family)